MLQTAREGQNTPHKSIFFILQNKTALFIATCQ